MRSLAFVGVFAFGLMTALSVVRAEGKLNAIELANHADEILRPTIATAVQEQIKAEVDRLTGPEGSRSFATLFLADEFYDSLVIGRFKGRPTVVWNGIADGRPIFYFAGRDFAYVTASGRKLEPKAMDTDGGSVPKILHSVGSFDPWTYGPAFLLHDWIFVAHKCGAAPDDDIDFETSALVMAEAMKTLMETGYETVDGIAQRLPKREDTLYVMYLAVKSSIARDLWEMTDSVTCR